MWLTSLCFFILGYSFPTGNSYHLPTPTYKGTGPHTLPFLGPLLLSYSPPFPQDVPMGLSPSLDIVGPHFFFLKSS